MAHQEYVIKNVLGTAYGGERSLVSLHSSLLTTYPQPVPTLLVPSVSCLKYVYIYPNTPQTASALGTFFLAMLHHPEVQTRARQELDAVVGNDRLPTFDDEASLPYITAVVKEVLRWKPVTPAG